MPAVDFNQDATTLLGGVVAPNGTFFQGIGFSPEDGCYYVTQIIPGGIQLPGEGAPVSANQRNINGDLTILKMTPAGDVLSSMYALRFGHGQTMGIQGDGTNTFIWIETDANLDGLTFGTGRKVGRIQYQPGAILTYGGPGVDVRDPIPGSIRIQVSFNVTRTRVLYSRVTTSREYVIYDYAAFTSGVYSPLYTVTPIGIGTQQSACIDDQYLYITEGDGGANNVYVSTWDYTTGTLVSKTFIPAGPSFLYREPEGSTFIPTPTGPQFVMSMVVNDTNPRGIALFGYGYPANTNALWSFDTPTVSEAPFAWNPLHERFRMNRGVSVFEVSPGQYEQVRYDAYTNEIGASNLPANPNEQDTNFWPAPRAGLHYFRGGYLHEVGDQVRSDIIASGAADASNFTSIPVPGFGDGGFGEGGFGG